MNTWISVCDLNKLNWRGGGIKLAIKHVSPQIWIKSVRHLRADALKDYLWKAIEEVDKILFSIIIAE